MLHTVIYATHTTYRHTPHADISHTDTCHTQSYTSTHAKLTLTSVLGDFSSLRDEGRAEDSPRSSQKEGAPHLTVPDLPTKQLGHHQVELFKEPQCPAKLSRLCHCCGLYCLHLLAFLSLDISAWVTDISLSSP